jgi:hypothetical protein
MQTHSLFRYPLRRELLCSLQFIEFTQFLPVLFYVTHRISAKLEDGPGQGDFEGGNWTRVLEDDTKWTGQIEPTRLEVDATSGC